MRKRNGSRACRCRRGARIRRELDGAAGFRARAALGGGCLPVTNYLKYVDAKKGGAAKKSLSPVPSSASSTSRGRLGIVIGANATNGTKLAVAYAATSAFSGGIDGHPIKLVTVLHRLGGGRGHAVRPEVPGEQGGHGDRRGRRRNRRDRCTRRSAAAAGDRRRVGDPGDDVEQRNGDPVRRRPARARRTGTYAKKVLHAKTARHVPEQPGIVPDAQAWIAGCEGRGSRSRASPTRRGRPT